MNQTAPTTTTQATLTRLERAVLGDITIEEVKCLMDWSRLNQSQFWAMFEVHSSTWHRWKSDGMPNHVRARVLTWWTLEWAKADAEFEAMTAGMPNNFRGYPPALDREQPALEASA